MSSRLKPNGVTPGNVLESKCFISCLDEFQPIDVVTEWFGNCWGSLPPSCWAKSNDSYWIGPTPFCVVDSPVAVSPECIFDPSISSNSLSSFSSFFEECSDSSRRESISLSPLIKSNFVFPQNEENKWRFPTTKLPPIPLPGWKPFP